MIFVSDLLPTTPMKLPLSLTKAVWLILVLGATTARADSSSALSASSASIGSVSTSLERSSQSSSGRDRVAQGRYTVVHVAHSQERPDQAQLQLLAEHGPSANETVLWLPRETVERERLATGISIVVSHRPYGLALVRENLGGTAAPFFLILDDAWYREVPSRPVML